MPAVNAVEDANAAHDIRNTLKLLQEWRVLDLFVVVVVVVVVIVVVVVVVFRPPFSFLSFFLYFDFLSFFL